MWEHKPLLVIVRAVERPGFHAVVAPPGCWIDEADAAHVKYWKFEGTGWHQIHAAALKAGFARANSVNKQMCMAWRIEDQDRDVTSVPLEWAAAQRYIKEIGKPPARVANNITYRPVKDPKPPGREGAARKLARTGLPSWLSCAQAKDICDMFAGMDPCAERERHIHFWAWAVKNKSGGV